MNGPIRRWMWTAAALACAAATVAAGPAGDRRLGRAFDGYARGLVEGGHLSGHLLVARGGRVLFERSWGLADREQGVPVTPETRFCVASITKPMTHMVATQLIAEGKLRPGDTLGTWIPGFPGGDRITVEHLMRHRAGIPHRVTTEQDETRPLTPADVVELAKTKPLEFAPGERSSYSSAGYTVLARVLELASGRDYGTLMRERLFAPLGMASTGHHDAREIVPRRASSYLPGKGGAFENAPLKDVAFLAGAGSVVSTARDLHAWLQAALEGRIAAVPPASLKRNGRISWNGSTNGFRAFVDWDSATGTAIVFTGNQTSGAPDVLREAIPRLLAGETLEPAAPPAVTAVRVSDDALRRCEGIYRLGNGQRLEVRAKDGFLYSSEWPLVPTSDTTYFSPRDWGRVTVVFAGERPERLDWRIAGTTHPAPRVGDLAEASASR